MSRFSSDEEQNMESRDYRVSDILSEYQDELQQEEARSVSSGRRLSRASLDALRASEEQEESVRIVLPPRSVSAPAGIRKLLFRRTSIPICRWPRRNRLRPPKKPAPI